jgi:hypothetical protein
MELIRSGIVVSYYSIATFVSSWWANHAGTDPNDRRSILIGAASSLALQQDPLPCLRHGSTVQHATPGMKHDFGEFMH